MSRPIEPNRADAIAKAAQQRLVNRVVKHAGKAVAALHDNQPGFPSGGDGPRGSGHSDPTAALALSDDQARNVLEEVTHLFRELDRVTDRLAVVVPSWANANEKWQESLRTEAASKLNDDHNWCQAHQAAGLLEHARSPGARLCRRCEADKAEIGADPPVWIIEKRHNGRYITTIDMARAKREAKAARKRRKR